jgi:PadR family transcriptional regulator, regulatory protein PadR
MAVEAPASERSIVADRDGFQRKGPGKRFIEPRILLLLARGPAHGYEIVGRMEEVPLPGPLPDTGAVYRKLRQMEEKRLIKSRWEGGGSGPRRRVYRINAEGQECLSLWVEAIRGRAAMLERFIALCEEEGIE